jgi:hypothetical protein
MSSPVEIELKERYAEALLRDPEPFRAAGKLGVDVAQQMYIAQNWPTDEFVIDEQSRLIELHGPEHYLPSKSDLARAIWSHAETCRDPDAKTKALKLYGEVMGHVSKTANVINNNFTKNNVMLVKDFGGRDEWGKAALDQQAKLVREASVE